MYLADRWWQRLGQCAMLKSPLRPRVGEFLMTALKIVGLAFAAVLWLSFALGAQAKDNGFLDRTYKDAEGKASKYVLFVPHDYNGDKPFPLILFLHGAGEREGGKRAPVEVGLGPA